MKYWPVMFETYVWFFSHLNEHFLFAISWFLHYSHRVHTLFIVLRCRQKIEKLYPGNNVYFCCDNNIINRFVLYRHHTAHAWTFVQRIISYQNKRKKINCTHRYVLLVSGRSSLLRYHKSIKQVLALPVRVFQNLMHLSAVPPPDARSPWWWGDQAIAFTAAMWSVKVYTGWLVMVAWNRILV